MSDNHAPAASSPRRMLQTATGLAALLLLAAPARGAVISPHDASSHMGQVVTVEGVARVQFTEHGSTLLAFDVIGKDGELMGVVPKDSVGKFKHPEYLNGKLIRITGKLMSDRGKPRIVLNAPGQISVK